MTIEKESGKAKYKDLLVELQIQLVKLQRHIISNNHQLLIIFEGRDAAGKDGVIKRITQHLSPRETRVMALGKPNERDKSSWYFQRYTPYLPSTQEMVLMNRSWYNRAGVERVMGFCTDAEYQHFMQSVIPFENMLIDAGIQIVKYYLDISKHEQQRRLEDRRVNPLKQWKVSPIDSVAIQHWDDYSLARNEMLIRSHTKSTPWYIVQADNKKQARLNIIRHMLTVTKCPDRDKRACACDKSIVFPFEDQHLRNGNLNP